MTEENNATATGLVLSGLPGLKGGGGNIPPLPPANPVVKNLWYNKKTLKIDGWTFESCRFDGCTLIVTSPFFAFVNCHFDDSNTVRWRGAIINALQLFNHQARSDEAQPFNSEKNDDGTVTIGGILGN